MPATLSTSYCGSPPLPDDLWGRWNFDPWLIGTMLLVTAYCFVRTSMPGERWQFACGKSVLCLVFVSPLCALTVSLFSARVVHHVLLVAVAAPLLASVLPLARVKLASLLTPLVLLHTVIFWLWHAPDAYSMALASAPVYWLMQVTLLGSAVILWAAILATTPGRAIGALLFLTIQMGLLGALLVFSTRPLYPPHFTTTAAFGFEPLADQQLAGLIMWVPASLPYVAVGLWRLLEVLRHPARHGA